MGVSYRRPKNLRTVVNLSLSLSSSGTVCRRSRISVGGPCHSGRFFRIGHVVKDLLYGLVDHYATFEVAFTKRQWEKPAVNNRLCRSWGSMGPLPLPTRRRPKRQRRQRRPRERRSRRRIDDRATSQETEPVAESGWSSSWQVVARPFASCGQEGRTNERNETDRCRRIECRIR